MAFYKHSNFLTPNQHAEFDVLHPPGYRPENSGVYRCRGCGKEVTTEKGNPLPPQNHHQHSNYTPIQWQLVVATQG